ncbi:MAG: tryptophan-rich sensory protein [Clostridiales bacterium]|nr:tryptophan-rich sensory protein [Clostridiales bacterium]
MSLTEKAAANAAAFAGINGCQTAYHVKEVICMSENQLTKTYTWRSLVALIVGTLGAGAAVGFLTQRDSSFYEELTKPVFAPPGWLFPIAWTLLYTAMAVSMWFVLREMGQDRFILLGLYIAQLAVNLLWPYLFFVQQALGLSFFWLLLLWMLAAIMLYQFFRESKVAGWLLVPYQLWLTFAAVLNFSIARLNP